MTQYEEIKILEARGLKELADMVRHEPKEIISQDDYELETYGSECAGEITRDSIIL